MCQPPVHDIYCDFSLSLGANRVRLSFNPENSEDVHWYKSISASAIDYLEKAKAEHSDPEVRRLYEIAQERFEDAAMWAVKAATV